MKPNQQFTYDVFLSHNSNDKDYVRDVAFHLKSAGLSVWFDEWTIKPGDDIYMKIERGLEESRILILCLTQNALNSDWINLERSTAIFRDPTNSERRFIPILLEACELPDTLKRYRYIDFRDKNDSSIKELLSACGLGDDGNDILWANNKVDDSEFSTEIEEIIGKAKKANRFGQYEDANELWNEVGEYASEIGDRKLSIRVRLELAYIEASDGSNDLDNALQIANDCLIESKKINLGNQLVRVLHLLGEVHRFKRNSDKSRGFLNAALECSRSSKDLCSEGWALIALGMLSNQNKEPFGVQFEFTEKAYDVFTKLLVSGIKDATEEANAGYGFCHLARAIIYGYKRPEEALTEYSRAISIYKEMGESWEYEVGRLLLERGEMQATKRDIQQAINDIGQASEIFKKLGSIYMEAKCILACAELLDNVGHRSESKKYYESAVQVVSKITEERKKGWFFFRYAMKLIELGDHEEAKKILLMLLSENSLRDSQKLDVLKRLSDLARVSNNEEELIKYEERSLALVEKLISETESPKERLSLLFNKGQALQELGKYEASLDAFQRAISLADSLSDKARLADCWASIAKVHCDMKNPKMERLAYEKVLDVVGDDKNSPQLVTTLTMLAQMDIKESNFNKAKELLDRAEILCKKVMPFMMFVINDINQRLEEEKAKQGTNE